MQENLLLNNDLDYEDHPPLDELQHQASNHTVQAESETQIHNQDKRVLQETNMRLKNKIIELVK